MDIRVSLVKADNRYRKDFGDLEKLKKSIQEIGLLQPIVIDENYRLVCGGRRLKAFQELGIEKIPSRTVNLEHLIYGEYAENEVRKDFTASERIAIGKAMEEALGERRGGDTSTGEQRNKENFPECKGKQTRDIAAEKAGFGNGKTYQQAKKVVDDGAAELVAAMDKGVVSISAAADVATLPKEEQAVIVAKGEREILEAAKNIRAEKAKAKRAERIEKIVEISKGNTELKTDKSYPVIYADPPWRYEHCETDSRQIENQYPTMSLDEICAINIPATDDAILFMWTTAPKLAEGLKVVEAWGFNYRSCAIWDKQNIGMGYYFRIQHEILLIATRGSLPTPEPANRPRSVISIKKSDHSAKPHEVAEMIETMYPELQKIEMFCRSPRKGWDVWGNQCA